MVPQEIIIPRPNPIQVGKPSIHKYGWQCHWMDNHLLYRGHEPLQAKRLNDTLQGFPRYEIASILFFSSLLYSSSIFIYLFTSSSLIYLEFQIQMILHRPFVYRELNSFLDKKQLSMTCCIYLSKTVANQPTNQRLSLSLSFHITNKNTNK